MSSEYPETGNFRAEGSLAPGEDRTNVLRLLSHNVSTVPAEFMSVFDYSTFSDADRIPLLRYT